MSRPTESALAAAAPTVSEPTSPGPAVTAIASTSARSTSASASARRMVGTIASRWAREAISGMIPPNRACSSTELAITSTSSSVPRTKATPVSSHEVSMPRTSRPSALTDEESTVWSRGLPVPLARSSGSHHRAVECGLRARCAGAPALHSRAGRAGGLGPIPELQPHHEPVHVLGLVVAPPDPDRHEAERLVQPVGGFVVDADLEPHLARAELACLLDHRGVQRLAVERRHAVAGERAVVLDTDVPMTGKAEVALDHGSRPRGGTWGRRTS